MQRRKKTMRPSRCSSLQPQEELQVGIRPRHCITLARDHVYEVLYGFFGVFVVAFLSAVGVFVVAFLSAVPFVPVTPLYALP